MRGAKKQGCKNIKMQDIENTKIRKAIKPDCQNARLRKCEIDSHNVKIGKCDNANM